MDTGAKFIGGGLGPSASAYGGLSAVGFGRREAQGEIQEVERKLWSYHPKDWYLWSVLGRLHGEWGTWLLNVQTGGYGEGHYFQDNEKAARADFAKRERDGFEPSRMGADGVELAEQAARHAEERWRAGRNPRAELSPRGRREARRRALRDIDRRGTMMLRLRRKAQGGQEGEAAPATEGAGHDEAYSCLARFEEQGWWDSADFRRGFLEAIQNEIRLAEGGE